MEAAENAAAKLGNAKGYKVDVANEEMVKSVVDQIMAERGTIGIINISSAKWQTSRRL